MPKPKSKEELILQSQNYFEQLIKLVFSIPPRERMKPFQTQGMNRNIRDVLIHLHAWHLLFLSWYRLGMKGKKAEMPAVGFSWKETPALNQKIWAENQTKDLASSIRNLKSSYTKVQRIIAAHSNEELYTKQKYPWTGSTSLAAYLISNTSSHYQWGIRQIKKGLV